MKNVLCQTQLRGALPDPQSVSSLVKSLTELCAASHQTASRVQHGASAHTTSTAAHTGDRVQHVGPDAKGGGESEDL